ncbi:hypothetical protein [Pseudoclavibacter helvolus]|uniref:hypothetical protein n=1 Tax=Pseudoclavibacter helvolus TaxID=255205 RepID=UPI00083971B1|nr:hypothetical protein [Pseudoclavibacter helvolus]
MTYTCTRCPRTFARDAADAAEWNAVLETGVVTAVICPSCQTSVEHLEAAVNEATTTYATDAFGRAVGTPTAA